MSRIPDEPISHEQQLMARLDGPDWVAWRRWALQRYDMYVQRLARDFVRRNELPDERDLQFKRGYLNGFQDALDGPVVFRKKLERLLAMREEV